MQPITPDDLYHHRHLQDLSASPKHGRAVFVVSRAKRGKDDYVSTAWLIDGAGGQRARQLTASTSSASSLLVDAEGERMAFVSRRDPEKPPQLHVIRLDGGEAREVTDSADGIAGLLAWSHDGRRVLATQSFKWKEDEGDDPEAESRPIVVRHLPYKLDGAGIQVGRRTRLVEVDIDSGDMRTLVEGDFDVADARWSPDGGQLAYSRKRGTRQRHRADLWLAKADGSDARQLTDDLYSVSGIAYSPDGGRIAFGAGRIEGDSIVNLYLLDVASGKRRCVQGDALQLEGSTIVWHPDGRRVATVAARRGLFEVTVVDLDSDEATPVDGGLRQVTALAASGDRLVFAAASITELDELYSVGWDGAGERRLTAFNRTWFNARIRPRADKRVFDVPDAKGGTEQVEAWLLRPPEGDGPFPLLVDFHGGPQSIALTDFASHIYWYPLLAEGWAVLAPNTVGSGSYGGEFARRLTGHWGEYDLPQVEAIVRQLRDEGIADERLGCYGKSYGGYLSRGARPTATCSRPRWSARR